LVRIVPEEFNDYVSTMLSVIVACSYMFLLTFKG